MAATHEIEFQQEDLPDGEAGIASINFSFVTFAGRHVALHCAMNADDSVMDASESDFPTFDCTLTAAQFHELVQRMRQFEACLEGLPLVP